MTERPILFSGPMVRAILDGRKTQTRRVVKHIQGMTEFVSEGRETKNIQQVLNDNPKIADSLHVFCPHGVPGDSLWVRETWATDRQLDHLKPNELPEWAGKWWMADGSSYRDIGAKPGRTRPSIHMPRRFSRLSLLIKSVRVERVQDIKAEDCFAEGIERSRGVTGLARLQREQPLVTDTGKVFTPYDLVAPRCAFQLLWDSINEKRGYSWESNPWVWVIEFERIA